MAIKKLSNGNLLVPMRAEGDSGAIGDALIEITPDHAQYKDWITYIEGTLAKEFKITFKGGKGSGHRGHAGRPGMVGGSAPGRGLTKSETVALHDFTWLTSQTINSELREGKVSTNKPFGIGMSRAEQVELMDSAISKATPTKSDTTLYSKMDAEFLVRTGKLKEGEIVHNLGYLSTTTREGGARSYPGQEYIAEAVLTLHISKGTRGILPLGGISHYPQEREHLVHRGSEYKILSVRTPKSYIDPIEIDAELIH